MANLHGNAQRAQALLAHAVRRIAATWSPSAAHDALAQALVTPPAAMSHDVCKRLHALIARYV
jgi:hypothetical protein